MILFISKTCSACTKDFIKLSKTWCPELDILEIREEDNKLCVYRDDEKISDEAPVETTPVLFDEAADEVVYGKFAIRDRLINYARKQHTTSKSDS